MSEFFSDSIQSIDLDTMQLSAPQLERLRGQLEASQRAFMLSALDHHRGREGLGMGIHATLQSGGSLPIIGGGRGLDHGYALYQHHIGGALAMIGGELPVIGAGLGSFLKKLGSLGKKAIAKVSGHAQKALAENKDRLIGIAKGAADHVMNSTGSLEERLKGGIAKAATESHDLLRQQAADRIRGLIS